MFSILDAEHGFPTYDAGIASDDLVDLKLKLSTAFDHGDLVVTTGGVSMGDKDLLRQILVQVSLFVLPSGHRLRVGLENLDHETWGITASSDGSIFCQIL